MKVRMLFFMILASVALTPSATQAAESDEIPSIDESVQSGNWGEPWKGPAHTKEFDLGVLAGLGVFDADAGITPQLLAAKKILSQGFAPDINNQVFAEIQVGPLFIPAYTVAMYSLHMRWDFHLDQTWVLYALGGLGGQAVLTNSVSGAGPSGPTWRLYPRFGAGVHWKFSDPLWARIELSHEMIVAGVMFGL